MTHRLLRLCIALFAFSTFLVFPTSGYAAVESLYTLPSVAGSKIFVNQGNGELEKSHKDEGYYAFDFTSQFNVAASRAGIVIGTRSDSDTYCGFKRCWLEANYVLIDHGDGTSALYLHLEKDSIKVKVGDRVSQRQEIARVGLSGWTTGLHLHFQVQKTPVDQKRLGWWYTQSLPVTFSNLEVLTQPDSSDGIPKYQQTFTVSGSKGDLLPSGAVTIRPGVSPSGNTTPSPGIVTTPPVPGIKPTPPKPIEPTIPSSLPTTTKPAPVGNFTIVDVWTTDSNDVKKDSFACSTQMRYRVDLLNETGASAQAEVKVWAFGKYASTQNREFPTGAIRFYTPDTTPASRTGSTGATVTVYLTYGGKTTTKRYNFKYCV